MKSSVKRRSAGINVLSVVRIRTRLLQMRSNKGKVSSASFCPSRYSLLIAFENNTLENGHPLTHERGRTTGIKGKMCLGMIVIIPTFR